MTNILLDTSQFNKMIKYITEQIQQSYALPTQMKMDISL